MGYSECLTCGLMTGRPDLHVVCGPAPARFRVCTCGSGAHPRRCAEHPDRYDAHVAELNAESEEEPADE